MPRIEMYASMWCGFCHAAKQLLRDKGIVWEEYDVDSDRTKRMEMMTRGGGRTVPQIFIDGTPVGGYDEINALNQAGKLDGMLGLTANDGGADGSGGD